MKEIKSMLLVTAGLCWLLFAAVSGLILIQYFTGGAGMQVFAHLGLSSITVAMGVGQVIGFVAAAFVCFSIGMFIVPAWIDTGSSRGRDRSGRAVYT